MKIREYKLVPLIELDLQSKLYIRHIRNEDSVRKWMYTDQIININEHIAWINRLEFDDSKIIFVVLDENKIPLGVVSLNALDYVQKRADWAYYLTSTAKGGGLGAAIEYSFINFVFEFIDIKKLNCEVIAGNDNVVKLHKKFLFKEEGFRRSNIFKGNIRLGVHLLGLTKEEWNNGKSDVYKKFNKVLDKFEISIQFDSIEKQNWNSHVDEIEAIHSKNNIDRINTPGVLFEKFQDTLEKVSDIQKISSVTQYPFPVELTKYNEDEDEKEMNRQFWELYDSEIEEIKSQPQHSNAMQ